MPQLDTGLDEPHTQELARTAVTAALEDIAAAFADVADVINHLNDAGEDLVRNIAVFSTRGNDAELHRLRPCHPLRDRAG